MIFGKAYAARPSVISLDEHKSMPCIITCGLGRKANHVGPIAGCVCLSTHGQSSSAAVGFGFDAASPSLPRMLPA